MNLHQNQPALGMIWAQTTDGVIGANNTIPWYLPEDFAHFRRTTSGHPVLMGRKTWDSLPIRPLPKRTNYVLTRNTMWQAEGAVPASSIGSALLQARTAPGGDLVWLIGGGTLYREALARAQVLVVTYIDTSLSGDTYAPTLGAEWRSTELAPQAKDAPWQLSSTGLRYRIMRWTKTKGTTMA